MSSRVLDLLLAYLLGGLTFLPACLTIIFVHAYLTWPVKYPLGVPGEDASDSLRQPKDDEKSLLSDKSTENLLERFRGNHEPDVAAGYFAVCREYVPGGVNGKPPERTTSAGAVRGMESPSVYQSMYRSIFDRKQPPSLDHGKADGRTTKRGSNVFFVVLRHGHLMLYEDSEQLEVKHVISLEYHNVSIYGGEEEIPEGELWIKRNAIRLVRKARKNEEVAKPFFLFSENCSEKEDFYFALLQNQDVEDGATDNPPRPLQYESRHIIGLVQKLHSSEERLQTRWINGMIGRLFLALYKTADVENFVRQKITKKIARVKKPAFLSGIVLQKINVGESAPQITNPKLKDLTIHGDCCAEVDVDYNGNFSIEIAATARLDLGSRFKAREVNLVLAVVVKKLKGHGLVKFKPSPSNRIWISFERMPDMDLVIEPVVSSRQITYGVILRAIQSRIREVVAETLVLPHWDDIPFTDTVGNDFRGGIWADQTPSVTSSADQAKIPDEAPQDDVDSDVDEASVAAPYTSRDERVVSTPALSTPVEDGQNVEVPDSPRALSHEDRGLSHTMQSKADKPPKVLRSTSFASAANPLLSNANADFVQHEQSKISKRQKDATSSMKAISHRSRPTSPADNPTLIARDLPAVNGSSRDANHAERSVPDTNQDVLNTGKLPRRLSASDSVAQSQASVSFSDSQKNQSTPSTMKEHLQSKPAVKGTKNSMAAIGAASAAAKKWGWGVLSRNPEPNGSTALDAARAGTPMGRGQPLPPPGQPLPSPNGHRAMSIPLSTPRRKPPPSPTFPQQSKEHQRGRLSPMPPLPSRRKRSLKASDNADEGLLVLQVPAEEERGASRSVDDLPASKGNPVQANVDLQHTHTASSSSVDAPSSDSPLSEVDDRGMHVDESLT